MRQSVRAVLALLTLLAPSAVFAQTTASLSAPALFQKVRQAVVTITTPDALGSGVLVDPEGIVVTNLHVVRGASKASVHLANGDVYDDVSVAEFDARKDLVLLRIRGFKLPVVPLGDSDALDIGTTVYAVGSPKGLELSLSQGIVSSVRDSGEGYRVIQTTAAISEGSSGGGLFDDNGRLVGITTFKIRGGENLNFALPINYARGMLGTSSRMTLAELNQRLGPESDTRPGEAASIEGAPRLAGAYRSVNGNLVVVEQSGDSVRLSYTNPNGVVYGNSTVTWDSAARAFKGPGILNTICGQVDTRIWPAPIQDEVYIVNENVVRERWTQPTRVNCDRRRLDAAVWQEAFWYVPPK